MKKFNETPEFLALQAEWDEKLRDEGFEDIEYRKDPTRMRGMSVGDLARGLYREDKEDYYRWARQHTHTMPEGPERHVWRLHAEGTSPKLIFKAVGRRYGLSLYRVGQIIAEQKTAMCARFDEEHEEAEQYTVRTLIAEETRPIWYTERARGSVSKEKK